LNFCLQHSVTPKNTRQPFVPGIETESLRAQLILQKLLLQLLCLGRYFGRDLDVLPSESGSSSQDGFRRSFTMC